MRRALIVFLAVAFVPLIWWAGGYDFNSRGEVLVCLLVLMPSIGLIADTFYCLTRGSRSRRSSRRHY